MGWKEGRKGGRKEKANMMVFFVSVIVAVVFDNNSHTDEEQEIKQAKHIRLTNPPPSLDRPTIQATDRPASQSASQPTDRQTDRPIKKPSVQRSDRPTDQTSSLLTQIA